MTSIDLNTVQLARSRRATFSATRSFLFVFVALFAFTRSFAQVPQLINFQGRVTVNGAPFNGTGQFKFALVNGNGTASYWSNNGSSSVGSEPSAIVSLPVSKGLYSVLLGDTALPNMTVIPNSVFNNSDVRLRVWFNDGLAGFQQLTPDQRIAAVGYAMMAGTVADGAITSAKIASGSVGPAQLATGAVGPSQLAPGAAAANLNAAGQAAVPKSGLVLSASEFNPTLVNAGYVRIGTVQTGGSWQEHAFEPPSERQLHTAIWTGSEMIIWGGSNGNFLGDGGRYNPVANTWIALPGLNAPCGRAYHTAVWANGEMIIWGGFNGNNLGDGARYDPFADSWAALPSFNSPSPRNSHTAVWTGTEMIVWGGFGANFLNDGSRYNRASDSWTRIPNSLLNTPGPRNAHSAVWTGSEMIVWGGNNGTPMNNGGRYNPGANTWSLIDNNIANTPVARFYHSAVWAGNQMLIWGGWNGGSGENSGGRYNPSANAWAAIPTGGGTRFNHSAIATQSEMIVWGGSDGTTTLNTGSRYNLAANSWSPTTLAGAPTKRSDHAAVWTGSEMVIWGGFDGSNALKDGGRYNAAAGTWTLLTESGAIPRRGGPLAVWTGNEMIVWGGGQYIELSPNSYSGVNLNDGGRYNPKANSWTPISINGAPPAGTYSAIWTGSEMIVWGTDGGRYNPALDTWSPVATLGAPSPRFFHSVVWTGSQMVVWGGVNGTFFRDGGHYDPAANTWTYVPAANTTPSGRWFQSTVWTGSEMVVWGGETQDNGSWKSLNDGARYSPSSRLWSPVSTVNPPSARSHHTAVWTGTEMIIWGGAFDNGSSSSPLNDGARYSPTANSWAPIYSTVSPPARSSHFAFWTGTDMIVWGGSASNDLWQYGANGWSQILANGPTSNDKTAVWTGSEMIVWGGGLFPFEATDGTWSYTPPRQMFLYQRP